MAEPKVAAAAAAAMEFEAPKTNPRLKREREERDDPAAGAAAEEAPAKKAKADDAVKGEEEKPVKLGPKKFATAGDMFTYFFNLLHAWSQNLALNKYEHMVLEDLVKTGHAEPTVKIGSGVESFEIGNHPNWQTRCFFVRRVDGSMVDFSYRRCIKNTR